MKLPSFVRVVEVLGAMAQAATVLSLIVIFVQLRDEAEGRRVERSLTFLQKFNESDMMNSRDALLRPWDDYQAELLEINARGMPDQAERVLVGKVLDQYWASKPAKSPYEAVHDITDFFDTLSTCVDTKACDESVVRRTLSTYAKSFRCTYGFIIEDQAKTFGTPELGSGLRKVAVAGPC